MEEAEPRERRDTNELLAYLRADLDDAQGVLDDLDAANVLVQLADAGETRKVRVKFERNSRALRKITRLLRKTNRAKRAKLIARVSAVGPGEFVSKERERIRLRL